MADLRLALRMMLKQPGMTALAVVALALGIGLTTTMFSIVNGAVLRGLPFPDSDRIVHVAPFNIEEQDDVDTRVHTYAEFVRRQQSFQDLAAFSFMAANVVGPDGIPERYRAAQITTNMLRVLRVPPMIGQEPREADGRPGAAPTVLIGEKVWRERFKGDPDVVGQSLRVNGTPMTVVGVMPAGFGFPQSQELWPTLIVNPDDTDVGGGPALEVIGRLRDGVSMEQAGAEFATIWNQLELEHPDRFKGFTTEVKTYVEEFLGTQIISTLLSMLAAVFGVLVIACANVANLVLARAADRGREIAVRTALGANRGRVIRQMLVEVLVLSAVGAALGIGLAQIGVTLFNRGIVDTNPPFWIDIRIDGTVLLFVTAASMAAALLAGIVPAVRASRADLSLMMNDEGRGTSSLRMGRFSRALVVVEMAVSFGLLVVSGLMIRTIVNTTTFDYGFAMADVWTARVNLARQEYPDDAARRRFMDDLLPRLGALPGARSVALASNVPLGGPRYGVKLPGRDYPTERDYHPARVLEVSTGYFDALSVPVEGRAFDTRDTAAGLPTVIVNQAFAEAHYPEGALGQQLALATGDHQQWRTIVGVVPNLGIGRNDPITGALYVPVDQMPTSSLLLIVRASGPPLNLTAPARDVVRELDPNLPIFNVTTVQDNVDAGTWPYRVFGSLFLAFGFAGLFLATVGLYGVMAFSVSRRTQEIGIRMAMGAAARDVLGLVLRQGLLQVGIGIVLGVGLAAALSHAMRFLFVGVNPLDPVMFVGVAVALSLTGLVACLVPARRAAAVDPMVALRYQ